MARTAYGFVGLTDLFNQRVEVVGPKRVFDAVKVSAAEYSRVANALLSEFAVRTTSAMEQIELPGSGTLQPLDADGNPLPVQPSGSYQVAYPIQGGGTAWGTNRVTRLLITVAEAERLTTDALQRDADWMIRHLLAAVFTNVTWTYQDEVGENGAKGLGPITIQPLANGDSVIYNRVGNVAPAIDTHFLAQAAAIGNAANPFPIIQRELHEHPSNGRGAIMVYVASDLVDSIMALSSFVENITNTPVIVGASTDTLSSVPDAGPADKVIGYIKGTDCWIAQWSALPSTYMVAKMVGKPFLKMREYPADGLKGFFPENFSPDGNHIINRMIRYAGFGVSDRVSALVYRIGNAAYAVPTGYLAPLPE